MPDHEAEQGDHRDGDTQQTPRVADGGVRPMRTTVVQPTSKKRGDKPTASMVSIYDGRVCVGAIKVGLRGDAVAHDTKGKRIGCFPSVTSAAAALKGIAVKS
jgi:hypothetical protein